MEEDDWAKKAYINSLPTGKGLFEQIDYTTKKSYNPSTVLESYKMVFLDFEEDTRRVNEIRDSIQVMSASSVVNKYPEEDLRKYLGEKETDELLFQRDLEITRKMLYNGL